MQLTGATKYVQFIEITNKMVYNENVKNLKRRKELIIMTNMFNNKLEVIRTFLSLTIFSVDF